MSSFHPVCYQSATKGQVISFSCYSQGRRSVGNRRTWDGGGDGDGDGEGGGDGVGSFGSAWRH